MKLANKVCLIIGSTGAIGGAVAQRFHAEGADLALTFLTERPRSLCEKLSQGPARVTTYRLDITDPALVQTVIQQITADLGGIDVIVNCSGLLGPVGPLETLDMVKWARTFEVNLLGSAYLACAALPFMKERGSGKLIFFSGGGAAYGRPFFTAYSSSKAAVVRFAESLAQELVPYKIGVHAIAPGPINSRMWDEMRAAGSAGGPKLLEELKRMDETGGASPDRAAELAVFLASGQSNHLTGRLLSAVWDDWEHLESRMEEISASEAFTLRRVGLK